MNEQSDNSLRNTCCSISFNSLIISYAKNHKDALTHYGSSWQLLSASVSFWQLLAASGSFWQLLAASGSFWQRLPASGIF
jgi:hypothetical protein